MSKKRQVDSSGYSTRFLRSTQGQVTLFMVVGMLLLLVFILVLTLKSEIVGIKPEELVPTEKGKIEQYITSCIDTIGEEGLFMLGLQGGYITVPAAIKSDGSVHLKISPFQVVPYWAYGEQTAIPSLEFMKQELDMYMEANLRSCMFSLQPFQEAYDIIEKSEITADTRIEKSKVIFKVHWEVEVRDKAGEKITEVINHVAESKVKLQTVYDTAREIMEREMVELKLEDLTQDLIALEHPKLPVAGFELSCKRKTWKVQEAKQTMQDLLRINIGQLKIRGTELVEFPEQLSYYTYHYVWDLGEQFVQPQVSVSFNYDNSYPFVFQVTPTEGNTMRSGMLGGTNILSYLCLQSWKFTYDVQYPVLVRVKDETTGYTFQMAFTVHLYRNMPNRAAVGASAPYALPFAVDDQYCEEPKIPMNVVAWEAVEAAGVVSPEPLEGVDVRFSCIKYGCEMGATEFNYARYGYQAVLQTNFPYCVGAAVIGNKEGYKEDFTRVVTEAGKTVELHLTPLFSFPVSGLKVVKHEFAAPGEPLGKAQPLDDDELALLRMKVYKDGEEFHTIEQILGPESEQGEIVLGDRTFAASDLLNVSFLAKADFTYEAEVTVFKDSNIVAGYKLNWTLPWDSLQEAQEIVFHTVSREKGNEEEQFDLLAHLGQYSNYVPAPELK